jgi:hypothetical protein
MQNNTILYLYSERQTLQLDPTYQRLGDIWTIEKRQLLIDSILNGFDIPKIYLHEFFPGPTSSEDYRFAIIDGKQRLTSIWGFIDNEFPLSEDITLIREPDAKVAGLTYEELSGKYPRISTRFDATSLPIIAVQTDDTDLIEDMFSRLNEAVPLNAAEKRNAFRGPLPPLIRQLARLRFFTKKLPSENTRYRHYDTAAKFLYFEHSKGVTDTKKAYLDEFVRNYRDKEKAEAAKDLYEQSERVLSAMTKVFTDNDPLLRPVGMLVLYYLLFREQIQTNGLAPIERSKLVAFEEARKENRLVAEGDISNANYELLEFDRYSQSPNDEVALKYRLKVLKRWIRKSRR